MSQEVFGPDDDTLPLIGTFDQDSTWEKISVRKKFTDIQIKLATYLSGPDSHNEAVRTSWDLVEFYLEQRKGEKIVILSSLYKESGET
jgi:hypothetical protein